MYRPKLERFEGPLDLLLQLIEREELSISEIVLAQVTEQYLAYLEAHVDLPPEELADFLVVAAKLLLLKSRILLPNLFVTDDEDGQSLTQQLTIYRAYVKAGQHIAARFRRWQISYARERMLPVTTATFSPPRDLASALLQSVFEGILRDLAEFVRPMPELITRTVSLADKIQALRTMLTEQTRLSFADLVGGAQSRMDVIITFLALLELVKQRHVVAVQTSHGGTITLVETASMAEAVA